MRIRSALTTCLMFCFTLFTSSRLVQGSVTYDRKSLVINGQRRILLSGSIHYPRSTPEMWPDLMRNAKSGGLDVIDTYVFWNVHQPSPNTFNFEGRYDLVKFIRTAQKEGLYVSLRIGPYICAEWNFGGFPVWLKNVPGISFRTDNEPFKIAMQGFVEKVVGLLRSEYLFEPQGGNIILTQIENEYGHLEQIYGTAGHDYMTWAASMAVQQGTGVPWVMCKQEDAPDPVINTCNGFYCDTFSPNKPYKPTVWTEAWTGWFGAIGGPTHQRHVQDLAFAVAQFIQKGGSFVNYYMYHGGTNFGRTGAPLITTSYDYDAPIDEYGLIRQPKYGHLKELHRAVKMCERAIVLADPIVTPLGDQQQAYVYYPENGVCAAFLSNHDTAVVRVMFNNMHYNLPPSSISILPDCKSVVFNTAKVGVQTSRVEMLPSKANTFFWKVYNDDIPLVDDRSTFTSYGLLEQINVTRDVSDYLWYITNVDISSREEFLNGGEWPTLTVESAGHALLVFVNGQFSESASGNAKNKRFTFVGKVNLHAGTNRIALLSVTSGLQNRGSHFETWSLGVTGPVLLHGIGRGTMDLSSQKWTYQVGLKGEAMNLASVDGAFSVDWIQDSLAVQKSYPLTWYKAKINAPEGDEPLALDLASMGKGQAWINGQSIGRYNLASAAGTCDTYSYSVRYQPEKFQTNCGRPTQRWYHVPRSWLNPTDNQLVLLEELGGNPTTVSLAKRSVTSVCAHISESHPTSKNWHGNPEERHPPKVVLLCGASQIITSIQFASYGTPSGTCGSFRQGPCHSPVSAAVLAQKCVGKPRCSVAVSSNKFGADPCPDTLKWLAVEAACGFK